LGRWVAREEMDFYPYADARATSNAEYDFWMQFFVGMVEPDVDSIG